MRYLILSLLFTLILSCSSDDYKNYNNPNLITVPVNYSINLDLPQFNNLKYPGNTAVIKHIGIKGVVVYAVSADLHIAHELSDPNHLPSNCSAMVIEGAHAVCKCPNDENEYNLVTGEHLTDKEKYPMIGYRAKREGNNIRVYN